jgi:hypothetical protein
VSALAISLRELCRVLGFGFRFDVGGMTCGVILSREAPRTDRQQPMKCAENESRYMISYQHLETVTESTDLRHVNGENIPE